jgi:hypothetical protein
MKITYESLDRKSEREGLFGGPVCRRKDTIKTDFIEIISEVLDWVCLAQDTCANMLMNIPHRKKKYIACAVILALVTIIFSGRFLHLKVKLYTF